MPKQKKNKNRKKRCLNKRLLKIKMKENILPKNGIEVGKKITNNAENLVFCVLRLLSICKDLQIGYSSKLNLQLVFSW